MTAFPKILASRSVAALKDPTIAARDQEVEEGKKWRVGGERGTHKGMRGKERAAHTAH